MSKRVNNKKGNSCRRRDPHQRSKVRSMGKPAQRMRAPANGLLSVIANMPGRSR